MCDTNIITLSESILEYFNYIRDHNNNPVITDGRYTLLKRIKHISDTIFSKEIFTDDYKLKNMTIKGLSIDETTDKSDTIHELSNEIEVLLCSYHIDNIYLIMCELNHLISKYGNYHSKIFSRWFTAGVTAHAMSI